MKPETIKKLKELALEVARAEQEDFNPMDDSGGYFDDAWESGIHDGMVMLAREILEMEGVK